METLKRGRGKIEQKGIQEGIGAGHIPGFESSWKKRQKKEIHDRQLTFTSLREMIEFRDPNKYKKDFVKYLENTAEKTFTILGEDINLVLPYKHRWAKCYRKGVLSKFIALGMWAKRHKLSCGMLSLTSEQTGLTDFEILDRFRESWYHLSDNLRKMKYQYIFMFEPHKSGIPHVHVMIFGECSQEHMDRLEGLWHDKYQMGAKGIDFDFKAGLKENIESIVNYLMKYLSKTIVSDIANNEMMIRFHALFYKTGARLFTSSRYLSFVMKKHVTQLRKVNFIYSDDAEIYNSYNSTSFPCKYGTWKLKDGGDGKIYKYELLPFEIHSKKERKYPFEPFSWMMKNTSLWFEMINYI